MRSDDCLRDVKLDQLGEQLKRCDRVVAAFPTNPAPLNDRYLLRSLTGPDQETAACADIRRATALARRAKPGSLDPQLRTDLHLRLALCKQPAKPTSQAAKP
jgi:class 3 adenylate cyclase